MKTSIFVFLLTVALVGCSDSDVNHAKRHLREVGHEAKATAEKVGRELKSEAKEAGQEIKKGAHEAAVQVKTGMQELKHKAESKDTDRR